MISCVNSNYSFSTRSRVFMMGLDVDFEKKQQEKVLTLKDLFSGTDVKLMKGDMKTPITNLNTDSRCIFPGGLFFALPGINTDGNNFIDDAIDRGAEHKLKGFRNASYLRTDDVRETLSIVAGKFFGNPEKSLGLIGVTGTNGKTTVSLLTQYLLKEDVVPVGLLGTIHYDLGLRKMPSDKTTPEIIDLYFMLKRMKEAGCQQVVMEASSQGIHQKRLKNVNFDVAVFLNLTREHLDYHKNMENYFEVKSQLFDGKNGHLPRAAVINYDDPYGQRLICQVPEGVKVVSFGFDKAAMIRAENVRMNPEGSEFDVIWPNGQASVKTYLLGEYNISNILAALAIGYVYNREMPFLVEKLANLPTVPGRMEKVDCGQKFTVLVDYAHTDDALDNALKMLRKITKGRLLTVFGCGGNRDRSKRSKMTEAVQRWSDFCWATSDNPRKENIEQIFNDMQPGVIRPQSIRFIQDRREAIKSAIDEAQEGDCILIAGKGHEAFQTFADTVVSFDDRLVARDLLKG